MSARRHDEHAALVEERGFEAFTTVPTVAFVYPDDGEIEPPLVRDRWSGGSMLQKCQRPFAPVPSGDALTRPMLDMRLFYGSGDGMNFWRRRIFRHGSNVALHFARSCVEEIQEVVTNEGKDPVF